MSLRMISSPMLPAGTSQSFSSTTRRSIPGRGRPQVPRIGGLGPTHRGDDVSVMLKPV